MDDGRAVVCAAACCGGAEFRAAVVWLSFVKSVAIAGGARGFARAVWSEHRLTAGLVE